MGNEYQFAANGSGWLYPKVVTYAWDELSDVVVAAGLAAVPVERQTAHKQSWFVATRADDAKRAAKVAERLMDGPYLPPPTEQEPEPDEGAEPRRLRDSLALIRGRRARRRAADGRA